MGRFRQVMLRLCWVNTPDGMKKRRVQLGDTDDSFIMVKSGVQPGDEVVLNPLAFVDEAQREALKPLEEVELADEPEAPAAEAMGQP